jgi:hypothetical protein
MLTGEPVMVRLELLQPTAVSFPEPIAAVPTGADPHKLSLELDGAHLFLQPLDPTVSGLLFALGVSGRRYAVRFAVASPADTEVVVTLPSAGSPAVALGSPSVRSGVTVRTLLRAMLQGTTLPGVQETPGAQDLGSVDGLRLTAVWTYRVGVLVGYIAEAINPSPTPQPLRIQALTTPGLKAIAADTDTVPAKGSARIYLIVQAGTP